MSRARLSSERLEDMIAFVTRGWIFTDEKYPELKGKNHQERRIWCLRHILEHQMKALGNLAAVVEACEHGGNLQEPRVKELTAKMLRNTLRISELMTMSADELLAELMR